MGLLKLLFAFLAPVGALRPGRHRESYRQVLHNFQNIHYYGDYTVGGQAISGLIDTGSWSLVVRSTRCQDCRHPTQPYNHSASKTYRLGGVFSTIVYAAGSCHTVSGFDSVSCGPLHAEDFVIQEIERHQLEILDGAKWAAVVGMARKTPSGYQPKSLFGAFGYDEFSVCFQKPTGSAGFLTYGPVLGSDMKAADYLPAKLVHEVHWTTTLQDIALINSTTASSAPILCQGGGCAVTLDTGSPLLAGPMSALMGLSKHVPVKSDCSNMQDLPTLRFKIDDHTFDLPPEAYVLRVKGTKEEMEAVYQIFPLAPRGAKSESCLAAFSPVGPIPGVKAQHWILGMPFFRWYHTTFDAKNEELRFAQAGPDCEPRPMGTEQHRASLLGSRGSASGVLEMPAAGLWKQLHGLQRLGEEAQS